MSIAWLAPAALMGLGLVALPIAIHLLVRQHARALPFPSLRFLQQTQLAALRRRTIQDALLLACRVAIIAAAAVALAGPVLQTASRTAGYATRVSRAVVPIGGAAPANLTDGAWAANTFDRPVLADALGDAIRWLDQRPASAREIVIAGALRRGAIVEGDLAIVPADIGIRFVAVPFESQADVVMPVLTRRNGVLARIDRPVQLDGDATRIADAGAVTVANDLVTIVAGPADSALATAALAAALDAGVPWSDFSQRVLIVWDGADPPANGATVVRMAVPSPPAAAADEVLATLSRVSPPTTMVEPAPITAEQLTAWSRPPGPPAADAPVVDEGDRRWLWALVLVLLLAECALRRRGAQPFSRIEDKEARVA
jgi:hypothetical protein